MTVMRLGARCGRLEVLVGLDNGITVRRNEFTTQLKRLRRFEASWDIRHEEDFSVAYWRNDYGLRRAFVEAGIVKTDGEKLLSIEEIDIIISIIKKYKKKTCCSLKEQLTWGFVQLFLDPNIRNLKALKRIKQKYGEKIEVEFYDSY